MHIRIEGLTKAYGKTRVLEAFSAEIAPGQIVAVLGSNGAGKTTLLRCLSTIASPTRGEILYEGEVLRRSRIDLRRQFAFLPDFPVVFTNQTPLRHLAMVLKLYGRSLQGEEQRVIEIFRGLEILPLMDTLLGKLSRGQLYKVALATVMLVDPELWLLDEPFASGMDPVGIAYFKERARGAVARGRSVIYSTQIVEIAEGFADRVMLIDGGKLVFYDTLQAARELSTGSSGVLEGLFRRLRQS